ncbi:MAG TPA: FAD/NAD(P)-binding oxidoreductase [Anaerolineales bacterium]|nr:FAD/NAD(P)-binding oxidoreductase [Anaerolineales bacterium]
MKRVLILGGGFGGIAAAHRIQQKLGSEVEVVLVDRHPFFIVGFRKSWALVGESTLEAGQKPIDSLSALGVDVRRATIEAIHPQEKAATVDGEKIQSDALIIALGAELNPSAMPGFVEHAYNVYDPNDIPRAEKALDEFKGGRLVIGIFGAPYKCPPAPLEMALLIQEKFKKTGVQATIEVFTPQPVTLPILSQASCDAVDSRLLEKGIHTYGHHKALSIQAAPGSASGEVIFEKRKIGFDLLLGVPPHRAPAVVRESGLVGESGWVEINPRTCATSFDGVYAIGDSTQIVLANKKTLPKAGLFAELMGETVAERLADEFNGKEPTTQFSGEGGCYFEVGNGEAMMIKGNFLAEPAPVVELTESSKEFYDQKVKFETDRWAKWFG